jgi:D-sedoheptulose 7-phosphate isomerase
MSILESIEESISVKELLKRDIPQIEQMADTVIRALKQGNKVLLCGNGGSAADAQHIACEFVAKLEKRRRSLPAISLTTNTSLLTAIANDDSIEDIFARQVEGLGNQGDVLIAISTSGNSPNIMKAVQQAKSMGICTIGLTGKKGDQLANLTDLSLRVPSERTQRIQEMHILVGHIICECVEQSI